ncbi:MAG TPA: M36 family metallopeptidase [Pyrinomonadaceae bacterium]|jgi:hypothetical protein
MKFRKICIYLSGGALALLAVFSLLSPFRNVIAGNQQNPRKNKSNPTSKRPNPPNFDALAETPARAERFAESDPAIEGGRVAQTEPRFGVPTFLWADGPAKAETANGDGSRRAGDKESAARAHLGRFAARYRLNKTDVATAKLAAVHDTGKGAIVVKFKQRLNGVEVFRDEVNVIMNRDLRLVALSGYLTGDRVGESLPDFNLQPADALAAAVQDLTGAPIDASLLQPAQNISADEAYQLFTADNASRAGVAFTDEPSRVKKVFFHLPEGYVPAYYVETGVMVPAADVLDASGSAIYEELGYSYVVSAIDGRVLFRNNLTAEQKRPNRVSGLAPSAAYTYRVWADPVTLIPYDTPAGNGAHPKPNPIPDGAQYPFLPQNDVTLQNFPFSKNDPWLPAGAVDTNGNNVDAFVNLTNPDGYGPVAPAPYDGTTSAGDFRALASGTSFPFTHVPDASPLSAAARQGSIQQLFYNLNFLHDWFYDAGFDEASGNAQNDNFGRGGLGGDSMKAQAQDVSGRNNANMLTPADGARPRMRMYLFDSNAPKFLDVLAPAAIAGKRAVGTSQSGPQTFDMTAQVVAAQPSDACSPLTNAAQVAGKIVLVQYPTPANCAPNTMTANLQNAGAVGFYMVWVPSNPNAAVNVTGFNAAQTIPFLSTSFNNAANIKTALANSQTVTVRFFRSAGAERDGTIDNQIVFHEWGHFISNRLVGNANGLNTNFSGGLGEGWGDFLGMLLTVRADDVSTPSNANWNGAYALATYATSGGPSGEGQHGYYWGIRRMPYSTDLMKNSLTYKHIANGNALNPGVPAGFGLDGADNAEVHNTGEVWSNMLWECYAALLRDTQGANPRLTFQQAQDRMKNYLVASLKMTPVSPTLLEARDAVLAAAFANDPLDGQLFAQAFAKRGAGSGAVSPDRYSSTNVGAVESFTLAGNLAYVGASLDDSIVSADNDGYLDSRERGLLKITVKNVGMAPISGASATVSWANAPLIFPNGTAVSFPTLQPQVPVTVSLPVEAGYMGTTLRTADFTFTINDSSNNLAAINASYSTYMNGDELAATTQTDTVEPQQSTWTVGSNVNLVQDAAAKFQRRATASMNYAWHAPDYDVPSDQYLVSPAMTVDGSGSVNLQFDHSWQFEFDAGGNYDGGVVEVSINGGAFTDLSTVAYNGTLTNYAGNLNPLQGRAAFVRSSGGTIHSSLTRAVAPGSVVQFRFRAASDNLLGAGGWLVDNIAVNGVVETPFATLVGELAPTAATVAIEGRVMAGDRGVQRAKVSYTDAGGAVHRAVTNSFGYYRFDDVRTGGIYVFTATSKGYTFNPVVLNVDDAVQNLDFYAAR